MLTLENIAVLIVPYVSHVLTYAKRLMASELRARGDNRKSARWRGKRGINSNVLLRALFPASLLGSGRWRCV